MINRIGATGVALGLVAAVSIGLLVVWHMRGESMDDNLRDALRQGSIDVLHRDLLGKQWTLSELDSVDVVFIPDGAGTQRALERAVHDRGRIEISSTQYVYQGTVRDESTNMVHLFGYRRADPRKWRWAGIYSESMPLQLERRLKQVEEMKQRSMPQSQ